MKSFFLCNGNETQEIMKPTGAHDFCGSLECSAQGNLEYCFVQAVDRFQKYSSDPGFGKGKE